MARVARTDLRYIYQHGRGEPNPRESRKFDSRSRKVSQPTNCPKKQVEIVVLYLIISLISLTSSQFPSVSCVVC
jgi:hypothetical protein